ncbi:unnamed protein product [Lepidochelys kempii]
MALPETQDQTSPLSFEESCSSCCNIQMQCHSPGPPKFARVLHKEEDTRTLGPVTPEPQLQETAQLPVQNTRRHLSARLEENMPSHLIQVLWGLRLQSCASGDHLRAQTRWSS